MARYANLFDGALTFARWRRRSEYRLQPLLKRSHCFAQFLAAGAQKLKPTS